MKVEFSRLVACAGLKRIIFGFTVLSKQNGATKRTGKINNLSFDLATYPHSRAVISC